MAISLARAHRHVADWTSKLARFPGRAPWPSRVFHTAQLEVAVEIIRAGMLACRQNVIEVLCDVANQGALWNNPNAHQFARLYFRPRNLFHLKTEGIKSSSDLHREDPHMSIPIAFAFRFTPVMCLENSYFVDGNFARTVAEPQSGDQAFDTLDFDMIYDDSPRTGVRAQAYQNARMSEVVVAQGLSLQFLEAIICRTIHEERTLRHRLAAEGLEAPPIRVEQKGSVFMRKGLLIEEIFVKDRMLHFRFRGPAVGIQPDYEVEVSCLTEQARVQFRLKPHAYRIPQILVRDPHAIWRVCIEGCLAYEGTVPGDVSVVS